MKVLRLSSVVHDDVWSIKVGGGVHDRSGRLPRAQIGGRQGGRVPHFSAWWGPHRKCPPLFGLKGHCIEFGVV